MEKVAATIFFDTSCRSTRPLKMVAGTFSS
jgi:hypothetical protein